MAAFILKSQPLFMVFDVESVGLHGEGFAVGYVVVDKHGFEHGSGLFCCHPADAEGEPDDRKWVYQHVPRMLPTHITPEQVRDAFWNEWQLWKERGAVLVADCAWPVEARFLARCVDDVPEFRDWSGPYPLHELASVLLARGRDPLQNHERLECELPAHHPLNDARQSARLLVEALQEKCGPSQ